MIETSVDSIKQKIFEAENQSEIRSSLKRGMDVIVAALGLCNFRTMPDNPTFLYNLATRHMANPGTGKCISFGKLMSDAESIVRKQIIVQREPGQDDASFQEAVLAKQQEYLESVKLVIETIRPAAEFRWLNRISGDFKSPGINETSDEKLANYKTIEFPLFQNDRVIFFAPPTFDTNKIEEIKSKIELVWSSLRSRNAEPQVLSVFLYDQKYFGSEAKSAAVMINNPYMLLEMDSDLIDPITIHESIHCVIGAEAGMPINWDYAEGCAMRLGIAFGNTTNTRLNLPTNYDGFDLLLKMDSAKQTKSHTQSLENLGQSRDSFVARDGTTLPAKELGYVVGYIVIDTLLKSQEFRQSSELARQAGDTPYRLLHEINRTLNFDNLQKAGLINPDGSYSNRAVLEFALKENGIDTDRFFNDMQFNLQRVKDRGY